MPQPFRIYSLAILLCFFVAATLAVQAQCTQKISDLHEAPELFGFHLGMTKEQVKALMPHTVFGRTDDFGVAKTTINPSFDERIDKSKFEGVRSISLDLLDDHLTSIWIGFDETFRVQPIDEFAKLISQSLKVPESWSSWKNKGLQIKCVDFQLIVTTIARGPSVRILNNAAEDTIAERRQAKEERDAAAEVAATEETPEIIADKKQKVYYRPSCLPAREIPEANKAQFKTVEEAEKAGFKLAKTCH